MRETDKTRLLWGDEEWAILSGEGIDIGCGDSPVTGAARRFDINDGDANHITEYVEDKFDFVYSSHCLEHMSDPRKAILEWWALVKPGGHLFVIVPDEDLYEQGVFPSRFNPDHKATFTISKSASWSAVSFNVLDLVRSLPCAELVSLTLQDQGYCRQLYRHGGFSRPWFLLRLMFQLNRRLNKRTGQANFIDKLMARYYPVDQTLTEAALAQIQFVVKKNC